MSKQPPPVPTASTIGPCPTVIQISRTPRHQKFTKHLRTTRPPLCVLTGLVSYSTKRRHKRGVHSNNTSSEFALEVSFSIVKVTLCRPCLIPEYFCSFSIHFNINQLKIFYFCSFYVYVLFFIMLAYLFGNYYLEDSIHQPICLLK